jgi:hypothetical protein
MNVTDKLYTEWAWRTKTGVPDINNPEDKAILDRLISDLVTEEEKEKKITKQSIIDLINSSNLDDRQIRKLYQRVQTFHAYRPLKKHLGVKKYDDILSKKFTGEIQAIIEDLDAKDTKNFIDYLDPASNRQVSFPVETSHKGFFKDLIAKTKLPTSILNAVSTHASQDKGRLGVGMGELGISILFKNIINSPSAGDLGVVDGEKVHKFEVKGENAKLGEAPRNHEASVLRLLEPYEFKLKGSKYEYKGEQRDKKDFAKILADIYKKADDKNTIKNGMDAILKGEVGLPIDSVNIDYSNPTSIQNSISLANFIRYATKENFTHFIAHDYGSEGNNKGEYIYVTGTPKNMADDLQKLGVKFQFIYPRLFQPRIGFKHHSDAK